MKRLAVWLLLAALAGAAQAQGNSPAAAEAAVLKPRYHGYAFEQPEILVRQRIFGLAHGLSLLAAACLDLPEQSGSTQEAYAAWHAKQAATIEKVALDLAHHYFGERAGEAAWADLTRALGLRENIQDALGVVQIEEACATLPTAIARPRYEFDRLLAEGNSAAVAGDATAAPPATPGPASAEPAKAAE